MFTFESNFNIRYCDNGGYVLTQNQVADNFEKAFSNLVDLVGFLTREKVKYCEEPTGKPVSGFLPLVQSQG